MDGGSPPVLHPAAEHAVRRRAAARPRPRDEAGGAGHARGRGLRGPRAGAEGRHAPAERERGLAMKPARLALEDGRTFTGVAFGADAETTGEVVFNTAMTGYQEV